MKKTLIVMFILTFLSSLSPDLWAEGSAQQNAVTQSKLDDYPFHHIWPKDHPLSKLMIAKMEFDNIYDAIANVMAQIPDCEYCSAANVVAVKLDTQVKKLEKVNTDLKQITVIPGELTLNEKTAAGMVYNSISLNALALAEKMTVIVEDADGQPEVAAWVPVAALLGIVADTASELTNERSEAICNPIYEMGECRESGCYWCNEYMFQCAESAGDIDIVNETCCPFITDQTNCQYAGCDWETTINNSYCTATRCIEP